MIIVDGFRFGEEEVTEGLQSEYLRDKKIQL